MATPTSAELDHPELNVLIVKYYADGMSSRERTAPHPCDFAGSALVGRAELYEGFYLASSRRMFQVAHAASVLESDLALVDSILRPK